MEPNQAFRWGRRALVAFGTAAVAYELAEGYINLDNTLSFYNFLGAGGLAALTGVIHIYFSDFEKKISDIIGKYKASFYIY